MTEIRGTVIELWLFHCSPPYRIIRAFHLNDSQGGGTMTPGTFVLSEEQLVVFHTGEMWDVSVGMHKHRFCGHLCPLCAVFVRQLTECR